MNKYSLPPDKLEELRTAQRALNEVLPEFDKAEECGVQCQEMRTLRDQAADRISKLLKNYGG